jgi:hypothetical protein
MSPALRLDCKGLARSTAEGRVRQAPPAHSDSFSALDLMPLSILLAIGGSPNSMKSIQDRFPGCARIRTISLVFPSGMGFKSQDQVLSGFS